MLADRDQVQPLFNGVPLGELQAGVEALLRPHRPVLAVLQHGVVGLGREAGVALVDGEAVGRPRAPLG